MLIGQRATVLGGGVAGLAVARALAMRGARVRLCEQAPALADIGAGLQIGPNGFAVIRALGLDRDLLARATPLAAVEIHDGLSADAEPRPLLRLPLAARGGHFLAVHRADLIAVLADGARAAGVEIATGTRIARVDLSGADPVTVEAGGAVAEAGLLIGADGLQSVVRSALNGAEAPFFTRQVAWRALVADRPGGSAVAEVHAGPGCHLVTYPLRGGQWRNIVAVQERDAWAAEGWQHGDDPARLRAAFAGFGPRVRDLLGGVQSCALWGLFRHRVAPRWHGGGAVILGDAAHPTLPFLAQGANMALEDAWVLAACLADHDDARAAMAAFQARRLQRTTRLVAGADGNARLYHLRGAARVLAHAGLRTAGRLAPGLAGRRALARYDWIWRHDVTTP